MPLYYATIPGRRKPLLIKAANATKGYSSLVKLEALTADEKDVALERGDKIWKPGEPLPEDDPEPKVEGEPEQAEEERQQES